MTVSVAADHAAAAGRTVLNGAAERAIVVICGSGVGVAVAADKRRERFMKGGH